MNSYDHNIQAGLKKWQRQMLRKPGFINRVARRMQTKVNSLIPEKIHQLLTTTIK